MQQSPVPVTHTQVVSSLPAAGARSLGQALWVWASVFSPPVWAAIAAGLVCVGCLMWGYEGARTEESEPGQ